MQSKTLSGLLLQGTSQILLGPGHLAVPGISSRTENAAHKITGMIMNNLPNGSPENSSDVAHNRKYYHLKEENAHIQHTYFLISTKIF